jgi:hypothetical protein
MRRRDFITLLRIGPETRPAIGVGCKTAEKRPVLLPLDDLDLLASVPEPTCRNICQGAFDALAMTGGIALESSDQDFAPLVAIWPFSLKNFVVLSRRLRAAS